MRKSKSHVETNRPLVQHKDDKIFESIVSGEKNSFLYNPKGSLCKPDKQNGFQCPFCHVTEISTDWPTSNPMIRNALEHFGNYHEAKIEAKNIRSDANFGTVFHITFLKRPQFESEIVGLEDNVLEKRISLRSATTFYYNPTGKLVSLRIRGSQKEHVFTCPHCKILVRRSCTEQSSNHEHVEDVLEHLVHEHQASIETIPISHTGLSLFEITLP